MIDTSQLTDLISALRAETEANSVTPERVGYLLQQIVDFLPSLDSSGLKSDVATALTTARQALSAAQSATSTAQAAQTAATSAQNVANSASTTATEASRLATAATNAVNELTRLQTAMMGITETVYGSSDLEDGYQYQAHTVGETAPAKPTSYSGQGCMQFRVLKGDVVIVAAHGGYYGRAWLLTDINRVILSVADSNADTTSSPVTLTVEQDGWFYTTCYATDYANFAVTHKTNTLAVRIGECETETESLDGRVDTIENVGLGVKKYDSADLEDGGQGKGQFWNLSRGVGSTVASKPQAHNEAHYWACLPQISVNKGDVVNISTKGGSNARAWALTDIARKILAVADDNTDTTASPITLTVETSGFLFVNCNVYSDPNFFVNIFPSISDAINGLRNEIKEMLATAHYKNNTMPMWKDSLKVLAIGNSYTQDSLSYLHAFRTAAGIETSKLCFYGLVKSSSSLENWSDIYDANDALSEHSASCVNYATQKASDPYYNPMNLSASNTLAEIFAKDWDVIVFQQFSNYANSYGTFNPYLTHLMQAARRHCTNPKVVFAWQSVWAWKGGRDAAYPESKTRWLEICAATQEMVRRDGIDIVIPTGTAVQNARNTATFVDHNGEMTRDGTHLAYGAGRYIATATWWQTLIAPVFGISVLGNTAVHETAEADSTYDFIAVDANNRELCQRCALAACVDMWSITDDIDPITEPEPETVES